MKKFVIISYILIFVIFGLLFAFMIDNILFLKSMTDSALPTEILFERNNPLIIVNIIGAVFLCFAIIGTVWSLIINFKNTQLNRKLNAIFKIYIFVALVFNLIIYFFNNDYFLKYLASIVNGFYEDAFMFLTPHYQLSVTGIVISSITLFLIFIAIIFNIISKRNKNIDIEKSKKINIIFNSIFLTLATITFGLQLSDLVFEGQNNDFSSQQVGEFVLKFFICVFTLISIILSVLYLLSLIDKVKKVNFSKTILLIFNILTIVCLVISFSLTLATTVDRFFQNFIYMKYTWEMTFESTILTRYLLTALFASIFTGICLMLSVFNLIKELSNKQRLIKISNSLQNIG